MLYARVLYAYARFIFVCYHTQRGLCAIWVLVLIYTLMQDPDLYCYSLPYFVDYDPEDIWALVQRHEGSLSPQFGGHYEFYIPRQYASILVLAFPMLRRQYQKDLYT